MFKQIIKCSQTYGGFENMIKAAVCFYNLETFLRYTFITINCPVKCGSVLHKDVRGSLEF
ncbi:hypothetical protein D3Z60_12035 [Lachnospiraceae bacterium]|nr:hypothetical protein [Lachnospiraceae bacterium]